MIWYLCCLTEVIDSKVANFLLLFFSIFFAISVSRIQIVYVCVWKRAPARTTDGGGLSLCCEDVVLVVLSLYGERSTDGYWRCC